MDKQNQLIKEEKSTKEDKKKLNPVIIEHEGMDIDNLEEIKKALTDSKIFDYKQESNKDMSDNFFRAVITEMMNDNNISLKTEYLNQNENFSGSKLEFLSKYANMPQLHDFIKILETKRVSLNRKSRIELIKAFDKREEEIQAQDRIRSFKDAMGF